MSTIPNGYREVVLAYGNPDKNGEVDPTWYDENTTTFDLPYPMHVAGTDKVITHCAVHKQCEAELRAIFTEIYNYARIVVKQKFGYNQTTAWYDTKTVTLLHELGLDQFGGCFNFRAIRGRTSLSIHAFAAAIDIDPLHNQLGAVTGRMPYWVVKIFKKYGWKWGGEFKSRKDWMHFQRATGC